VGCRPEKVATKSVPNKLHPTEKYDRHVYGYSEKYFECPQQQLLLQTAIYQWQKLTTKENLTKRKALQK
jgi:hypothetical protein